MEASAVAIAFDGDKRIRDKARARPQDKRREAKRARKRKAKRKPQREGMSAFWLRGIDLLLIRRGGADVSEVCVATRA